MNVTYEVTGTCAKTAQVPVINFSDKFQEWVE